MSTHEHRDNPDNSTNPDLSGSANDVVQARDVHGGVHFHSTRRPGRNSPVPKQLPGDVHYFVNRGAEITKLNQFATSESRTNAHGAVSVIVITGTAGVGKTSLALHWAHQVRDQFPDGQLYVNLRGYDPGQPITPGQALDRFLRALGVPASAIPTDVETAAEAYRSIIADQRILIVLDNAANLAQVRPLLPGTASCLVLVTSRSRLSGLAVWSGAQKVFVDVFPEDEAVNLLVTTTSDHRSHDSVGDLVQLARLCARLPLALRIAAERAASRPRMPLGELVRDLRNESTLWDALATDDGAGETIRSVFAWSYRALPADVAKLFRSLGMHPGLDFDSSSAAALSGFSPDHVRQLMDVLVGAHLVEQTGSDRYQFHDLLKVYAVSEANRDETPEERAAALHRLLAWFLRSAHAAASAIDSHFRSPALPEFPFTVHARTFRDLDDAIDWYHSEAPNLVAVTKAAARIEEYDLAWRLSAVLRKIYAFHNPVEDWITVATIGLSAARKSGDPAGEADNLDSLGMAYAQSGKPDRGLDLHLAALELWSAVADPHGQAVCHNSIGLIHLRARRLHQANDHFTSCLDLVRQLRDRRWEGIALGNIGNTLQYLGRTDEALPLVEQALEIHRETGNRVSEGGSLIVLGAINQALGNHHQALADVRSAVEISRELKSSARESFGLLHLGQLEIEVGRPEDALVTFQRAAVLLRQLRDRNREAQAFDGTGRAYRELGRPAEALDFHRRAVQLHRDSNDQWQLALALDQLAVTLDADGDRQAALRHWGEARRLLDPYQNAQAAEIRARIDPLLPN
ncbi:tetratricopeptide repeat protein [Saccharothrix sp. 6-C]|uniref:ATP-binding protein n=1 Tax=Saccharothrix sp. 6-C TaxID=2781735 RepID=UPI00191767D4|nr:tetratricopeptide repeat protein [Saccharothrix sp. 6-C]QQQ78430.1 tetratricopeptide repeat protein [Saccharothrix sp. 6-C]